MSLINPIDLKNVDFEEQPLPILKTDQTLKYLT